MSLVYCWEEAQGFPTAVQRVLSTQPILQDLEMLLAIPEHKVNLPGAGAASQNDLFVLARSSSSLVTIMVEGKVSEPFGPLVSEWNADPSPGKIVRLRVLCQTLGLSEAQVQNVCYQLLHRTASAIIETRQFHAKAAVMLVHSFSKTCEWFEDYRQFAGLYGVEVVPNQIVRAGESGGIELFQGWVADAGEYGSGKATAFPVPGTLVARKCPHCGHHEIGIETGDGEFFPVKPGEKVQILGGKTNDAAD